MNVLRPKRRSFLRELKIFEQKRKCFENAFEAFENANVIPGLEESLWGRGRGGGGNLKYLDREPRSGSASSEPISHFL